jgi:hypothetical protein
MPGIPQGQEEMPVSKTTKCNAIEEHHIFGMVLLLISRATLYQVMKWHRLGPGHGEALETLVQKTPRMGKAASVNTCKQQVALKYVLSRQHDLSHELWTPGFERFPGYGRERLDGATQRMAEHI